jgi:hypothetical protein
MPPSRLWARSSYLKGQIHEKQRNFGLAVTEYMLAGDECPRETLLAAAVSCMECEGYAEAINAFVYLREGERLLDVAYALIEKEDKDDILTCDMPLARMALVEAAKLGM